MPAASRITGFSLAWFCCVGVEMKLDPAIISRQSPVTVLSAEVNAEAKPEAESCSVEAGDANEVIRTLGPPSLV